MLGKDEIEHRFGYHQGSTTMSTHREIRLKFRELAEWLDEMLPDSRAKSLAFTELENASMWSHKAIAETAPLIKDYP